MEIKDIPQDDSESYHGHLKVIYGTRDGRYEAGTSSGWQDEAYATEMAVAELNEQTHAAREAVARGEYSPLPPRRNRVGNGSRRMEMAAPPPSASRNLRQAARQNPAKIRRRAANQHRRIEAGGHGLR